MLSCLLVALVLVSAIWYGVWVAHWAEPKVHYRLRIQSLGGFGPPVAGDPSQYREGFVLTNASDRGSILDLGFWGMSEEVEFPAAFAFVNLENLDLRLTLIQVDVADSRKIPPAWDVVLHENESRRTYLGDTTSLDGGSAPPHACPPDGGAAFLVYYISGQGATNHLHDGFVLNNKSRLDGYNSALTSLRYHTDVPGDDEENGVTLGTAESPAGRQVWVDPSDAHGVDSRCGKVTGDNIGGSQSNLIWVSFVKRAGMESPGEGTLSFFYSSI